MGFQRDNFCSSKGVAENLVLSSVSVTQVLDEHDFRESPKVLAEM